MIESKTKPIHITYILSTYPGLTTTFVDREVLALQKMGVRLQILALQQPITLLSEEQKEIQKYVTYLQPMRWTAGIKAHLRFLLTRPGRYFSTLVYLLTRPLDTPNARRKVLRQFSMGILAADLLSREPIDHLHLHIVKWGIVALVASRILEIPYSVTAHASGDIFVEPVLLAEKLGNAKFVATCTRYNMSYLKQYGKGVFGDKVKCIYHGLDVRAYRRTRPVQNGSWPVILSVGQLKERKGFQVLIDACAILKKQGLDFTCRIIGEGPLRSELEAQIERLGLQENVSLAGALSHEQVFHEYEQAHLFTLPALLASDGDRDGIPNVILEAMAMELPVVSTRHSAIPEAVEDGVNGLLVPPGDSEALAAAISRLLADAELRHQLGRRGQQRVADQFDPDKNARQLLEEMLA